MATPHTFQPAGEFSANEQAALVAFGIVLIALWLLPTLLAAARRLPNVGEIAVLNILLGWLPMWWAICLARACRHVERRRQARATTQSPIGGWLPDPINPQRWRYHDGHQWTDFVHVAVGRDPVPLAVRGSGQSITKTWADGTDSSRAPRAQPDGGDHSPAHRDRGDGTARVHDAAGARHRSRIVLR